MSENQKSGERIAKVLARVGIASRREAERIIEAGRISVNGKQIDSPALNVGPKDRITLDGQPIAAAEPARLWLYYKPEGLVTTTSDEKGRETVFDTLPEDMPRVMSVGRLDLNSEGLLLLTNDGGLKRRLELPSTGWLRKYRVRVNGTPSDAILDPLRKGITIEGERFLPMEVSLDRQQGANAWLTIGLREGRNREIRRAMTAVGLIVNRLIRVSYGPFRLNEMEPGDVIEVKARVLRDQLGEGVLPDQPAAKPAKPAKPRTQASRPGKPGAPSARPATAVRAGSKPPAKPATKPDSKAFSGRSPAAGTAAPTARSDGPRSDSPRSDAPRKGKPAGPARSYDSADPAARERRGKPGAGKGGGSSRPQSTRSSPKPAPTRPSGPKGGGAKGGGPKAGGPKAGGRS